jgi:hypothetical protein
VDDWLAGLRDRSLIGPDYLSSVAIALRAGLLDLPADGLLFPELGLTRRELLPLLQRTFMEPVVSRATKPAPAEDPVTGYPTLARGSKGAMVLLLESRLAALHYPCGPVDGTYDHRTRDAVLAFQKAERLKRTGRVDDTVWAAFLRAQPPKPLLQGSGDRLECDLTRQTLMMIRDERVIMVLHVSTGAFGTPTGAWRLRTKRWGWAECSLGPIYSPCYFMPKNAIHGYPSVPTYPASHGCIRTPIWAQDVLWRELSIGMPVDVFYSSKMKKD